MSMQTTPEQSPLDPDRLYRLLPAYIRQRDAESGQPLRAMLRAIAQQVNAIDLNIAQLYDNLFIETCQDWAVPYIADLIGYKPLRAVLPVGDARPGDVEANLRQRVITPRRDVANMLRDRRRKGTADVLRQIAWDVTGWPAELVENIDAMDTSVSVVHKDLTFGRTASLKGSSESSAPSQPAAGSQGFSTDSGAGVNDIELQVWRKRSFSVHWTQAQAVAGAGKNCFSFHPLGMTFPLFAALDKQLDREDGTNPNPVPEPWQFPGPIKRALLTKHTENGPIASSNVYGENGSILIRCGEWAGLKEARAPAPGELDHIIPAEQVVPVDLTNWNNYVPKEGSVGLDPETGRLIFPPHQPPKSVRVSYYYGATAPIGGGEYERGPWPESQHVYTVGKGADGTFLTITAAIEACEDDARRLSVGGATTSILRVIEICDSSIYHEHFNVKLFARQRLQIRARNGCRPIMRIAPQKTGQSKCSVHGLPNSEITIDGLMIVSGELQITGAIAEISLIHCTLIPGLEIDAPDAPISRDHIGILIDDTVGELSIDHCVLGPIQVRSGESKSSPVRIVATDSIIDANLMDFAAPALEGKTQNFAIRAVGLSRAHAIAHFTCCTVIGETRIHTIALAENCIFRHTVEVTRINSGQIRFSWVQNALDGTKRVPPLIMCQPTPANDALPKFENLQFAMPGYAALAIDGPQGILHGADDGSELGAFHDLFRSVRVANLQTRLQEFVPVGASAKVVEQT